MRVITNKHLLVRLFLEKKISSVQRPLDHNIKLIDHEWETNVLFVVGAIESVYHAFDWMITNANIYVHFEATHSEQKKLNSCTPNRKKPLQNVIWTCQTTKHINQLLKFNTVFPHSLDLGRMQIYIALLFFRRWFFLVNMLATTIYPNLYL